MGLKVSPESALRVMQGWYDISINDDEIMKYRSLCVETDQLACFLDKAEKEQTKKIHEICNAILKDFKLRPIHEKEWLAKWISRNSQCIGLTYVGAYRPLHHLFTSIDIIKKSSLGPASDQLVKSLIKEYNP